MGRAFCGMHGRVPTSKTVHLLRQECNEVVPLTTLVSESEKAAASGSSEMYHKALRVKSLKMYEWLLSESAVFHLFIACSCIANLEMCMFTFMKWQELDTWIQTDNSPLVRMSNMATSPAAKAVRQLSSLMTSCAFGADSVSIEDFTAGLQQQAVAVTVLVSFALLLPFLSAITFGKMKSRKGSSVLHPFYSIQFNSIIKFDSISVL